MTRPEVLAVLRVLSAAWPAHPLTDDTIELWVRTLATDDAAAAMAAAERLVATEQWFPSLARLREAMRGERTRSAAKALPAPTRAGETPPEVVPARIAALRSVLRSRS